MTGDYRIFAEEPEDIEKDPAYDKIKKEHPFWDNVKLEDSESRFKVEEYKRPKFDIVFDPIKDSFVFKDSISITGYAKAYDGSSVSNASVKFNIRRIRNYYDDYNDDAIWEETTTKTDASGKFVIRFATKVVDGLTVEKKPVYNFEIKTAVTDITGETISKETEVKVGFHNLQINAFIDHEITSTEKTIISLQTTNLNGVFKPAKGEVKIYFIKAFNNQFKRRENRAPEISTISKSDFEKLFPYEKYENNDDDFNIEGKSATKTLLFDTKIAKEIPLGLTSNDKSGFYKIVFSAVDDNGNNIVYSHDFTFKNEELLENQQRIITVKQLNDDAKKDGFATLKITSPISDLYVLVNAGYKTRKIYEAGLQLKNNEIIVKVPIDKAFVNSINYGFDIIFENEHFHEYFKTELKELEVPKLVIETETFRNKIEPGTLENWSFKLSQANNSEEAEMLATMYDASLDQFFQKDWENLRFNLDQSNRISNKNKIGFERAQLFFIQFKFSFRIT